MGVRPLNEAPGQPGMNAPMGGLTLAEPAQWPVSRKPGG